MRTTALFFVTLCWFVSALAQEGDNAPLELGRPSATPIKIKRTPPPPPPDLEPPPQEAVKKRKIVKKKKLKKETIAAPQPQPAEPAAVAPTPTPTPAPAPAPAPSPAPVVAAPAAPSPTVTPPAVTSPTVNKTVNTKPAPQVQAPVATSKKVNPVGEAVLTATKSETSLRQRALLNFRVANIWALRNRTNSGSFMIGWDPVILPWKRFNFGTTLGVTQFQSESVAGRSADNFFVYEYGVSTSYYLSRVFLPELVIGGQTWAEDGGSTSSLLIALNANFLFKRRQFKFVDRAYFGMGSLQVSGGSTNIFRAGIGLRF